MMKFPDKMQQGQGLTAAYINQIVQSVLRSVVGGKGIQVRRTGNQIIIDNLGNLGRSASATGTETVVEVVESLPAIPDEGMLEVFWTSAGAGDGDDQVWRAFAGQAEWTPTQYASALSGDPPS